jgi:hypothetical protein
MHLMQCCRRGLGSYHVHLEKCEAGLQATEKRNENRNIVYAWSGVSNVGAIERAKTGPL